MHPQTFRGAAKDASSLTAQGMAWSDNLRHQIAPHMFAIQTSDGAHVPAGVATESFHYNIGDKLANTNI